MACSALATPPPWRPECRSFAGAGHSELQRGKAAIGDGDGGLVGAPHRAVGRQHEIGAQLLGVRRDEGAEMRAAALFLALDHQLEVDRQLAGGLEERFRRLDRDQHRPLVIRHAARIEAVVAHLRLERRRLPLLQRIGRLHVVVSVDQDGRRALGMQPVGGDDRVAFGRVDRHMLEAGAAHALRHPFGGFGDMLGIGRIGADAGDAGEGDQLVQNLRAASFDIFQRAHAATSLRRPTALVR